MGRPRSERAHQQVLEAALKLFSERGIAATSMDAIAEASGVSKATIYKHWADKDALCLEAMAHAHGLDEEPPHFHGDDVRTALIRVLSHRHREEYAARSSGAAFHCACGAQSRLWDGLAFAGDGTAATVFEANTETGRGRRLVPG